MRLRIVEFANELQNYKPSDNEKIIALNPSSQSFLKRRKIEFENSLNFFGMEGHLSILRQSKKIMDNIKRFNNFHDKNNISISYIDGLNHYLTFYIRYLLILLYIIDKVIKKYQPKEIIVPESTLIENFDYYWSEKDRLLGYLVKKYIKENHLKINVIEEKRAKKSIISNFFLPKKYLQKLIFFVSNFVFKYFFNKKNIFFVVNDSNNFSNIISKIKTERPELKPVFLGLSIKGLKNYGLDILRGKTFNLFFNSHLSNLKETSDIKKKINNFIQLLKKDNETSKNISFFNVSLIEEISIFIENTMFKAMKELNAQVTHLTKVLKITNPKFMLSQHTSFIGCAFGELGNIYNIPAMVVSHGSHVSHLNNDVKHECLFLAEAMINRIFPYIAVQNPYMLEFLKDNNYRNNQMISTGPLLYNKIKYNKEELYEIKKKIFKEGRDRKIILHAGTPKNRGSDRLLIYETVDEYIKNINDQIDIFKKKKNIFFAIKYRDNSMISLNDFKELINESEFCKFYHQGNFSDFLAVSDVMISYSSTTIDEALYNRVPVILYDSDNKYSHIKTSKIDKNKFDLNEGIFHCSKLEDLSFAVDKILENNNDKFKQNDLIWGKYILNNNKNWLSNITEKSH